MSQKSKIQTVKIGLKAAILSKQLAEDCLQWIPITSKFEKDRIEKLISHLDKKITRLQGKNDNAVAAVAARASEKARPERPEDFLFAMKASFSVFPSSSDLFNIYVCRKSQWLASNQRFPWQPIAFKNWDLREEFDKFLREQDNGMFVMEGCLAEDFKQRLLGLGMVEEPKIATTLHRFPPNKKQKDWTCL